MSHLHNPEIFYTIARQKEYLPIPTLVPTVNSEKSIFHSAKGTRGLFRKDDDCNTLFHVDMKSSSLKKSEVPLLSGV